jgi:hypothetical protein
MRQVSFTEKNILAAIAAQDDVIKSTGIMDAGFAGHALKIAWNTLSACLSSSCLLINVSIIGL